MKTINAICIKPGKIPLPCSIEASALSLARLVNIDKNGNPHKNFAPFEISEIKDNVNVISSPKGEERGLPVVRTIGRYIKLYGVVYIVKMDSNDEFIDLTRSEIVDYCVKFINDTISFEELGLPSIQYPDDIDAEDAFSYERFDDKSEDDGYRRITITFDEPECMDEDDDW